MRSRSSIIFLLCMISIAHIKSKFVDINVKNPQLINSQKMRFCYISFVDIKGTVFLVKQKRFIRKLLGKEMSMNVIWLIIYY